MASVVAKIPDVRQSCFTDLSTSVLHRQRARGLCWMAVILRRLFALMPKLNFLSQLRRKRRASRDGMQELFKR